MADWLKKLKIDTTTRNVGEWTIRTASSWIVATHNPSGYTMCTYRKQLETATGITTASGSIYQTSSNMEVGFPVTFSTIKDVSVDVQCSQYPVWTAIMNVTNSAVAFRMLSGSSRSAGTGYWIMIRCEGYVS